MNSAEFSGVSALTSGRSMADIARRAMPDPDIRLNRSDCVPFTNGQALAERTERVVQE